ncbi:polyadenylate-binding protein RBP45 [Eurytemora carolleeae]|uniref:polyadenylate-binding protein RBP45 n=1 Tax=Eurytemora carolleeae TaxID=1294199 RepID=UPI000C77761D|nr:polyadenylate-binding protein RBP45 [Eurytemora carolleeae]|eukprot:XP_023329967.1 polyadenylate-binding protein RBP45-like [Eurytemora affinis]
MSGKKDPREQDPLDPENDLFWDPDLLRQPPPPPPPSQDKYSLKPVDPAPKVEQEAINVSTTLKRPAGPAAPFDTQVDTASISEPDAKKLRETAQAFGYGNQNPGEQIRVSAATEGFRKMYVGALHMHTTEKSLTDYFSQFGEVQHCQVLRDKETGMTKGYGFVTMASANMCAKVLSKSVHVVDNRTIRVSLTHSTKNLDFKPKNPKNYEEKIDLIHEVGMIDVREGRIYVGTLPDNVSPNILASHFSQYGIVTTSNVSRAVHNTMKKNFGVVNFKETMAVKRVLQNPRHYINEKYIDVTLSKFGMETLLSDSIVWLWGLDWSVNNDDISRHFQQFGAVYHAMHIFNPVSGEKRGYGFVDFVDESSTKKCLAASQKSQNRFEVKGQRGHFGKFLPQKTKRDLMYIEDRFGNLLLKQMYDKVPSSGTWGGGKDHNDSIRSTGARTITCKLPKQMLPVVVGDDGKIVADIARDSKTKITLIKAAPQETACLFHIVGNEQNCKTAQYMMQIKIKERVQKGTETKHSR